MGQWRIPDLYGRNVQGTCFDVFEKEHHTELQCSFILQRDKSLIISKFLYEQSSQHFQLLSARNRKEKEESIQHSIFCKQLSMCANSLLTLQHPLSSQGNLTGLSEQFTTKLPEHADQR